MQKTGFLLLLVLCIAACQSGPQRSALEENDRVSAASLPLASTGVGVVSFVKVGFR